MSDQQVNEPPARTIATLNIPRTVGYWILGGEWGLHLSAVRRPNWLHRKLNLWLLGIDWRDAPDE